MGKCEWSWQGRDATEEPPGAACTEDALHAALKLLLAAGATEGAGSGA